MKKISITPPRMLQPKEDTIARQLLSNIRDNMPSRSQTAHRQAIAFEHWNADGKYSHRSMGTKFRRYGTWK